MGLEVVPLDTKSASDAPRWLVSTSWHMLGHRPPHLGAFSRRVVDICRAHRPDVLLTTGSAPIRANALREIASLGVRRLNYSTDDPWSKVQRSRWLFDSLLEYDTIFSPRRANLADLRALDRPTVQYLPFAFDPALHYPRRTEKIEDSIASEVLFVGGADPDRVAILRGLVDEGFDLALYGGYWDRYPTTKRAARGIASPDIIREATYAAAVCLCLVRKSNRDGHVMRSFEIPALGGCMLIEDTEEHRAMFGDEAQAVLYFRDAVELSTKLRWLLSHPSQRATLSSVAARQVATQENTYQARLAAMLADCSS